MKRFITAAVAAATIASPSFAGENDAERIVRDSANRFGVSAEFAVAIAIIETGLSCGVVGARGELGLLQVNPATARFVGYRISRSSSCAEKTDAGMAALKYCLDETGGDKMAAARCHNGGLSAAYSRGGAVNRYASRVARIENGEAGR